MMQPTLWALSSLLVLEALFLLLIPERLKAILVEVTPAQMRLIGIIEILLAAAVISIALNG